MLEGPTIFPWSGSSDKMLNGLGVSVLLNTILE